MNTSFAPSKSWCSSRLGRASRALVMAAWFVQFPAAGQAQSLADDFDDGNDMGWTQFDPRGLLGQGPQAEFRFPNNSAYRISTPINTSLNSFGPGRAGATRQDGLFAEFYVTVDVIDWDDTTRQAFGVLARVNTPGLGTLGCYAFTYERGSGVTPTSGELDISLVVNELPSTIGEGGGAYHFDSTKDYRLVFIGRGDELEGRVYELPDVANPVRSITAVDTNFVTGTVGLVTFDNTDGAGVTDATFDNFVAQASEPPRLSVTANALGEVEVRWSTELGQYELQTADSLATPIQWRPVENQIFDEPPDGKLYLDGFPIGTRVFRLFTD